MQSPFESPRSTVHPEISGQASPRQIAQYDFAWLLTVLERYGKKWYGEHFVIRAEDHDIIRKLLVYFLADEAQAADLGIDLSRGILLTGPIGCGKTSLMSLIAHLTTNLSATEIEVMYGPRVRSRVREMFNLVAFEYAEDKRRGLLPGRPLINP